MKDDEVILAELRKISAWADLQRRMTRWSLIFLAVFIPAMILLVVLLERRLGAELESIGAGETQTPDWYDVDQSVRRGDFDKAIQIGEKLILKTPHYPEAHRRLAGAYLAAGDVEKARRYYAEAFRLFPSEENEKSLAAMDRRMKAVNPSRTE
jgi:tetratricopeptide (TPR) repeat protein